MFKKRKFHSGALPDIRPPEEKQKDYKAEEVYSASPVVGESGDTGKINYKYLLESIIIHNQDGASSCVSNACSYIIAINNFLEEGAYKHFSARGIYPRRTNKPAEGMYFDDAAKLLTQFGGVEEALMPSDNKGETELNKLDGSLPSYETIGKIYAPKNYIGLNLTIDDFAQALSQGRPILMGVRFGDGEWGTDVPIIKSGEVKYGHGIVALGYFYYQGKKAILIVDSWGVTNPMKGFRILTEDGFTQSRITAGIQFLDLQNKTFDSTTILPSYVFNQDLEVGMSGDDVKHLQEILNLLGYFPSITYTGYFGGLTRSSLIAFQIAKGIIQTKEDVGAGRCGPKTREVLNKLNK